MGEAFRIQYQYTTTPAIDFVLTEEGRARKSGTVYKYEYDLKDHLGNTRVTTTWNASDATQMTPINSQRSDYYAFGYAIQSLIGTMPSSPNRYLYNNKELQDETGLYDYGVRFYDPVIGRWNTIDPLAFLYFPVSPYIYTSNNPVNLVDPDGKEVVGTTAEDARKALEDLKAFFAASRFDKFRELLKLDKSGKKISNLSADDIKIALDGATLSDDDRASLAITTATINSTCVHEVEYKCLIN